MNPLDLQIVRHALKVPREDLETDPALQALGRIADLLVTMEIALQNTKKRLEKTLSFGPGYYDVQAALDLAKGQYPDSRLARWPPFQNPLSEQLRRTWPLDDRPEGRSDVARCLCRPMCMGYTSHTLKINLRTQHPDGPNPDLTWEEHFAKALAHRAAQAPEAQKR